MGLHVYWDWDQKVISHWDQAAGTVAYLCSDHPDFPIGGARFGTLTVLPSGVFARTWAVGNIGFALDGLLTPSSAVAWTGEVGTSPDQGSGVYDASTGLLWLMSDAPAGDFAWSWEAFSIDAVGNGVFDHGAADTYVASTASNTVFGGSPVLVDGWLYRNINARSGIDRVRVADGKWEIDDHIRSADGTAWAREVIGYDAALGIICTDGVFVESYPVNSFTWVDSADYETQPWPPPTYVAAPTNSWDISPADGSSDHRWSNFLNGKVYFARTLSSPVWGTDFGVDANGFGFGSYSQLCSLTLATGVVAVELDIPYGKVDAYGAAVPDASPGYYVGDDLVRGMVIVEDPVPVVSDEALATRRRFGR